jgi:hypothetical protein
MRYFYNHTFTFSLMFSVIILHFCIFLTSYPGCFQLNNYVVRPTCGVFHFLLNLHIYRFQGLSRWGTKLTFIIKWRKSPHSASNNTCKLYSNSEYF